mgnify:CR=1 FL=1
MTAQEKLLKDIMAELITVSRDPRLDLNDADDRQHAGEQFLLHHSLLSASMGAIFAALLAG